MIAYVKGPITYKSPTYIIVEAGGIGYHINISLYTYARIEPLEEVRLLTHLHIKEDSHTLFGFAEDAERTLFVQLLSVSGVGPSTAQLLLSAMSPDEIKAAIVGENEQAFRPVKGVGPKTAKRIILDLKDKILRDGGEIAPVLSPANNTIREEALSALIALGFSRIPVQKALNQLLKEQPAITSVEELIKLALKKMA